MQGCSAGRFGSPEASLLGMQMAVFSRVLRVWQMLEVCTRKFVCVCARVMWLCLALIVQVCGVHLSVYIWCFSKKKLPISKCFGTHLCCLTSIVAALGPYCTHSKCRMLVLFRDDGLLGHGAGPVPGMSSSQPYHKRKGTAIITPSAQLGKQRPRTCDLPNSDTARPFQ